MSLCFNGSANKIADSSYDETIDHHSHLTINGRSQSHHHSHLHHHQHHLAYLPSEKSLRCADFVEIYFDRKYESPDVLVVAGLTMMLIGLGVVLIGLYVYLDDEVVHEMTFFVGLSMISIGAVCCCCRAILFASTSLQGCYGSSSIPLYHHGKRRPTNPPFFTAASSAMSTATLIGIRYNRGQSLSGVSQVVNSFHDKYDMERRGEKETKTTASNGNHVCHPIDYGSFESIESIKDEDESKIVKPIDASVLQYIARLGKSVN